MKAVNTVYVTVEYTFEGECGEGELLAAALKHAAAFTDIGSQLKMKRTYKVLNSRTKSVVTQ